MHRYLFRMIVFVLMLLAITSMLFYGRAYAGQVDWPTFGYDISRTGFNPNETTLGVSNVPNLQLIWSFDLGAVTIMQPAVASGVMINGSPVNVLYMGAQHGEFYALNADTGSVIWQTNLGSQATDCFDMPDGVFGVGGTPYLDRAANLLYVVGGDGNAHALDLSTGAEAAGWPVTVTNIPAFEYTYGGVNVQNGKLYAEVASYCDHGGYYGRVTEIDIATASVVGQWYVTNQPVTGGGIWGPGGVSIDPATQHVFAATGNAFANPESSDYGDQVVELSSSLSVLGANYPGLTGNDVDFGATPILFQLPGCNPMVAAKNKSGVFVVYYRGQVSNGPVQRIQMADVTNDQFNGIPAWSPVTNMLYIGNSSDSGDGAYTHGMVALQAGPSCTLVPSWQQSVGPNLSSVSPPVVANGVVYYGDGPGNQLLAFDAAKGTPLWNSGSTITGPIYSAPTVVNGILYAGSWDHKIYAFSIPSGSLTVTIGPAAVANAGAMWSVDGEAWQASGSTVSNLSLRPHTVTFSGVQGWSTPSDQTAYITIGQTASAIGTYIPVYAAIFTASTTSGKKPLKVHFTNGSVGSFTKWLWNFGDGKTSKVWNPTHTYSKAGTYTVTLTLTGAKGTITGTQHGYVTVYAAPKAHFSAVPRSGDAPLLVNFTNESTGIVTSWLWNFGDGTTSTDENPAHTYNSTGTHKAKLTVYGPGGSGSKTMSITVKK